MRHKDNSSKLQSLDHGVQISLLILSGVRIARRFIRRPPPEKIKCHYSTRRRQIGNKAIVKVKIVWKAMHQNDRRFGARILSGVNAVLVSLYKMFLELHFSVRSRITDPARARDTAVRVGAPISTARPSSWSLGERLLAHFFSRPQKLVTESRAGHRPR